MNRNTKSTIKRDCCRFMRTAIIASLLHRLVNIAAPTVAAWMIGDMANYLMSLDGEAIAAGFPSFLCAVIFQVVVAALLNLALSLLLTKQGFAYDGFLMEKFIRLPLHIVETTDAGSVMERLEEDSAAFCWNQMTLHAYPGAILMYFVVFGYAMIQNILSNAVSHCSKTNHTDFFHISHHCFHYLKASFRGFCGENSTYCKITDYFFLAISALAFVTIESTSIP